MKTKLIYWILATLLIFSLSACNMPFGAQATVDSAAISTIIAQNVLLTQLAQTLAAPLPQPLPTNTEQSLLPQATPTVTLTPMPLLSPTPEGVWLTINQNSNCRVGPANYYLLVATLKIGDKVQVVGRDPYNEYFYVRTPNSSSTMCWVWKKYTSVAGDIGVLPVFTAQPTATMTVTPSPAPGITVTYETTTSCGPAYALRLVVRNTGGITWQSIKVVVVDSTTGTTFTHTSDSFKGYTGCASDVVQADLTTGEDGIVSNANPGEFGYNPAGHNLSVTVTVYSTDGLGGTSATQTINVTP